MTSYLLIESRDPFESKGLSQRCELALMLLAQDAGVTLCLVENGVLGARAGAKVPGLDRLAKAGVRVLADEFALQERGISRLAPDISRVTLDSVVAELTGGAVTLWN